MCDVLLTTEVFSNQDLAASVLLDQHGRVEVYEDFPVEIQPETIDLSTRLQGINHANFVVLTQNLMLRSIVLSLIDIWKLIH